MKHPVHDFMSKDLVTLFEEQTIPLAKELLELKRIRHLPVVDDSGTLVGVVTHRDILRAQASCLGESGQGPGGPAYDVPVRAIMTREIRTVSPNTPAAEAAELLKKHAFSCLPVVDENHKLVGLITEADFLDYALAILRLEDS